MVDLEKFYKRNSGDTLMFGYISALLYNLPTTTLQRAMLNYMKFTNLSEETTNVNTLIVTYSRMKKEFYETQKSDNV